MGEGLRGTTSPTGPTSSAARVADDAMADLAARTGTRSGPRLRLRFSERRVLLTILDLGALSCGLVLAQGLRLGLHFDWTLPLRRPGWFAVLALIWLIMAPTFDAYEPRIARHLGPSVGAAVKAGLLTSVLYVIIPYVTPPLPASRFELVMFPFLISAVLAAERTIHTFVFPRPAFRQPTLILGTGRAAHLIAEALAEVGDDSYRVLGFVASDSHADGVAYRTAEDASPEAALPNVLGAEGRLPPPILGARGDLMRLVERYEVSALILATTQRVDSVLLQTLVECVERGVEVIPMAVLYERLTGRVPVEHVHEDWYVALPVEQLTHSTVRLVTKRALDVVLAGFGLMCLALLLPFIALAIRLDSRGPIFYVQERIGVGGRIFRTYKFRSMIVGAEQNGAVWAQAGDPRVTRVGRFLRASHIDEFPQFVNVMKGDMSAVGPRPERPEFVERFAAELPLYRLRHVVKPGMAGWGLIRQGYAATEQDVLVRLQYDLYYIKHQSVWLDVIILLKTLAHALALRGRW